MSRSPFPGMDPYLEARWPDVHSKLVTYVGEALTPLLPRDLRARSEERLLVEKVDDPKTYIRSDVAVVRTRPDNGGAVVAVAVPASDVEPYLIEWDAPPFDAFVQIIDVTHGNQVVTVIEVLSPWNKRPGRLNDDYVKKVWECLTAGVSVVEIDLLRDTRRFMTVPGERLPDEGRAPYYTLVCRGWGRRVWEVYPMSLRRPLPRIPIPLRQTDAPVSLELQPLIERAYAAGGHDDIDYTRPPTPPLEGEDAAWVQELLGKAGRTPA